MLSSQLLYLLTGTRNVVPRWLMPYILVLLALATSILVMQMFLLKSSIVHGGSPVFLGTPDSLELVPLALAQESLQVFFSLLRSPENKTFVRQNCRHKPPSRRIAGG